MSYSPNKYIVKQGQIQELWCFSILVQVKAHQDNQLYLIEGDLESYVENIKEILLVLKIIKRNFNPSSS